MKNKILNCIYTLFLFCFILIFNIRCKKEVDIPVLETSPLSLITQNAATCGGNITLDGGADIKAKGVCWSTSTTPTIANNKTNDGEGAGSFTSTIIGLNPDTKYYVKAYATNSKGTGYGNTISFTTRGTATDIDGNVYLTINLDGQVWMTENLKTTRYRNGDPIPNVTDSVEWKNLTTGAYSNYDNDVNNATTYGRLYNWYAVKDSRNIAPVGWHVSRDYEWDILIAYLLGDSVAGGKLKETGTTHWSSPNVGATDEVGFTALPGGYRNKYGLFFSKGNYGYWVSFIQSTPYIESWCRLIGNDFGTINNIYYTKSCGMSVRCVKDI